MRVYITSHPSFGIIEVEADQLTETTVRVETKIFTKPHWHLDLERAHVFADRARQRALNSARYRVRKLEEQMQRPLQVVKWGNIRWRGSLARRSNESYGNSNKGITASGGGSI